MSNILKSDLYRFGKSKLFYGITVFTVIIAFVLTMLIRQDIRLGISVFGGLTVFKNIEDILRIGVEYYKGLGIFVAILISVFIGQEYQWKTWQHKWIINKSRTYIYLSKAIISSVVSAVIFQIFELVALLSSKQISDIFVNGYVSIIICGLFIYAALGTVISMLSMLIKNSTLATIVCLCYVMFSETFVSVIRSISHLSTNIETLVELCIQYSIYGMAILVSTTTVSTSLMMTIIINSLAIMFLTTVIGLMVFRRYEL